MGVFDLFNPASAYRTPGRVTPPQYEEETTLVPGSGFRGAGATGDLPRPMWAPWVRNLSGQISRGAQFVRNAGQAALATRGLADFPDLPPDLPAARPDTVNALPPAANSFEEQVRASMFGAQAPRTGPAQSPPIPMRTPNSPTMSGSSYGGGMKSPPIRAIRLPNGQFLYTNNPETGGEEFSTQDAGLIGRAQTGEIGVADNRERPYRLDPESDIAKALQQRAAAALSRGTQVPGKPYDPSGAIGTIEGTPEQRRGLALDEAIGATDLARAQSAREFAELPIDRQAMVSNPDLVAGAAATKQMQKQIGQARQEAEIAAEELSTPGHPKFIQDEAARRLALRDLEARRDNAVQDALAVGSLMMGRSIPQR